MENYEWKAQTSYGLFFCLGALAPSEDEARKKVLDSIRRIDSFQAQFQRIQNDLNDLYAKIDACNMVVNQQSKLKKNNQPQDVVGLEKAQQSFKEFYQQVLLLNEEQKMIERHCFVNQIISVLRTTLSEFSSTMQVSYGDENITLVELIARTPEKSIFHSVSLCIAPE